MFLYDESTGGILVSIFIYLILASISADKANRRDKIIAVLFLDTTGMILLYWIPYLILKLVEAPKVEEKAMMFTLWVASLMHLSFIVRSNIKKID